uniref:Uncharacterized protein n=1 Tax=Heterorhabditis bacteriophora TaxID=37862 RepID=A0A1I7WAF8_HETBA
MYFNICYIYMLNCDFFKLLKCGFGMQVHYCKDIVMILKYLTLRYTNSVDLV